jgi:hypothetical protein
MRRRLLRLPCAVAIAVLAGAAIDPGVTGAQLDVGAVAEDVASTLPLDTSATTTSVSVSGSSTSAAVSVSAPAPVPSASVSTPTVPSVSTPTVPSVSTPTVPSVSTPTVPSVSTPTVPPPPPLPAPPATPVPSVQAPSVSTPAVPSAPGVTPSGSAAPSGAQPTSSNGGPDAVGGGASAASPAGSPAERPSSTRARGGRRDAGGGRRSAASGGPAAQQRRLERTVAQLQGCLGTLSTSERRVLALRAGLGPRPALSRPRVARRLGMSLRRTGAIERRGLRRLDALGAAGRCGTSAEPAVAYGLLATAAGGLGAAWDPLSARMGAGRGASQRPRSGIGGVVASGGGGSLGDALPPPIGHGSDWTVLILLTLLATLGLLVRRELRRH